MKSFVLIHKGQNTINGEEAAMMVADRGFSATAADLGVSVSTLRKFLHQEGYRFTRNTSWQVEQLPGMEPDAEHEDAATSTAEHQGAPRGLGGVEVGGVQS